MSELTDFINNELLPRVLENMDTIFPERNWQKIGYRWSSPYHTDGSESKSGARERSYIKTDSNYCYNVGETDGGKSTSLIDYALIYKGYTPGAKGQEFIDTIKWLCEETDIQLPEYNNQDYERYKQHEETIQNLYSEMQKKLFTDEGKEVLSYLTDVRGYDIDLIKKMGLGYINKEITDKINNQRLPLSFNPNANKMIEDGKEKSLPYGVGVTHNLVIPYMSGGHIRGFKFREIRDNKDKSGKTLSKYYNNYGLPKSQYLFGFRGLKLTGNGIKDRDLTIVEGELDALHAQVLGVENIVAAAGGYFDTKVIEDAKAKGVTRITLLFDTEDSEEKQMSTYSKITTAIKKIRQGGLTAFYAALPSEPGKKMDVDEYLRHHTADDLREIIKDADPASYYLFRIQLLTAIKRQEQEGKLTSKNIDEFLRQTIEIANSEYTTPIEREIIFREFEIASGKQISKDTITEFADKIDSDNVRRKTQKLIESKLQKLLDGVKSEGYNEYLDAIRSLSTDINKDISKENSIDYLADDTDEIFESFQQVFKYINTDIEFRDFYGNLTRFIIPEGITTIAAHTGHGKSKVMQHIALGEALNNEEGCVIYIPYEESKKQTVANMLNIYANLDLRRDNSGHSNGRVINEYLYDGNTSNMKSEQISSFKRKIEEFKQILHERKIKVIKPETPYLEELLTILNSVLTQNKIKIKAIFIDYVQEIYIENTKYQRPDELKEVMVGLDLITQRYATPIVLAAQLNAQSAQSPLALTNQCIADSYWIARKSSEIIMIWSSKECCKNDQNGKMTEAVRNIIPEFNIGEAGQLYCLYTKSRFIPTGISAVLDIDGNTGHIEGNYARKDLQQKLQLGIESKKTINSRY